jgi:hypothetical protein
MERGFQDLPVGNFKFPLGAVWNVATGAMRLASWHLRLLYAIQHPERSCWTVLDLLLESCCTWHQYMALNITMFLSYEFSLVINSNKCCLSVWKNLEWSSFQQFA